MNRRVLIIGGNSQIAIAAAELFRAAGNTVGGVGLTSDGQEHYDWFAVGDCSISAEADTVVADAAARLGGLDTLILAAAAMPVAPLAGTTDEQWRTAIGATLDSAFFVLRASLPHLGEGAAVVAISSTNATLAAPGLPAYAAAKAGLEGLVRQAALEYGPRGVRFNVVRPATVNTRQYDAEGYPLRRTGHPDELAKAIYFLGTDDSSWVTGSTLVVDGGLSISSPTAWLRSDLRERWL
jgi:meso-butanediol dehydrogenase/(S,S)-butanediol dehydrogenase/diacetyl reductase